MMQIVNFLVGLLVLGSVLGSLMTGLLTHPLYAQQAQVEQTPEPTLDELQQTLFSGTPAAQVAAITSVVQGDDEFEKRIRIIIAAMAKSDRSIQSICKIWIRKVGDRLNPTVRELFDSTNLSDRIQACGIVFAMSNGDDFADDVLSMLKEEEPHLRHAALYALQNMSPEVIAKELDLITKQLDSTNFNTQCVACAVLRHAGPIAKPSVDRLVQLYDNGNVSSRSRATQALAAIGPVEQHDIPALVAKQLGSFAHVAKTRALEAMVDLGPAAEAHLDKIEDLMTDPTHHCICEAALAYYQVSGEAQRPVQILTDEASKEAYRLVAIECLGGMKADAAQAVPTLIEFLDNEDLVIAETAVLALKNIGPAAEAALPQLRKMADHEDFLMSFAVKEAIESITDTKNQR